MGTRLLVTFLGTGKYETVVYRFRDARSKPTPYIQEALLDMIERDMIPFHPDVVIPVLTPEAERAHWHHRQGHEYDPDPCVSQGLYPRIQEWQRRQEAKGITVVIDPLFVETPADERAMWTTFDALYRRMVGSGDEACEVVVDVTHSFRYQPMLMLTLLHFAHVVAGTKTVAVFYGSQPRKLASGGEVEGTSAFSEADVLDLAPLVDLQQWILHVHTFLHGANAEGLYRFIDEIGRSLAKSAAAARDPVLSHISDVRGVAKTWDALTKAMQLCRGPRIPALSRQAVRDQEQLIRSWQEGDAVASLQPIYYLLDKIHKEISALAVDHDYDAYLAAVDWCCDQGLYQQAYTLLRELWVTAVCDVMGLDGNVLQDRKRAEHVLGAGVQYLMNGEGTVDPQLPDWLVSHREVLQSWDQLSQARNDLNHAAFGRASAQPSHVLIAKLTEFKALTRRFLVDLGLLEGGNVHGASR